MEYLYIPYHVVHFSERINLKPYQLSRDIDQQVSDRARQKLQGKCTQFGYIRPNSVIVISRTMGYQRSCHFNGEMTFDIELVADICKPLRGDQIYCEVQNINRMGLLAKAGDQKELHIYIVLQHHNNSVFFEDERLKEACHILVEVVGSKSKLNDDKIIVIGKLIKIYDENALDDFPDKFVKIPVNVDQSAWELSAIPDIPDQKASLGHEAYISSIKSLLGKVQEDVKTEILREVQACHLTRDETILNGEEKSKDEKAINAATINAQKAWTRACNLARSMTNEFELVHPPFFYDRNPPVRAYKPISRAFYKMWELLKDFELLPAAKSTKSPGRMVFAHLAESPGSFIEACLCYRQDIKKKGSDNLSEDELQDVSDPVFVMSLKQATATAPDTPSGDMLDNLSKRYPNVRLVTGGKDSSNIPHGYKSRQGDGTGDLFKLGNILDFAADVQSIDGADLVTSDLGFSFDDVENNREQCMHFPIFAQICAILSCQKKGGHCILKVFDVFTKVTVKLIMAIGSFYRETYITKPFTSRTGNPEKYLVCKCFKGITKQELRTLYRVFEQWSSIELEVGARYNTNSTFVADLNNGKIPLDICEAILSFNMTHAAQRQVRTLSNIIFLLKNYDHIDDHILAAKERQAVSARSWFSRYMQL